MRVIKRGNAPPPKVYQPTCDHCGTQVEFDENDPEIKRFRAGLQGEVGYSVRCPVCTTTISVEA